MEAHIDHARGFAAAARAERPARVVDLGSGGGVPGLVLALVWAESALTLVDSSERRTQFLSTAVGRLGVADRVTVVRERAEDLGRTRAWRGSVDVVVARGFGSPAVVAECAAPLLRVDGEVIVSEPPVGDEGRWPPPGLALLGLRPGHRWEDGARSYQVLVQHQPCPERYPRRTGVPAKRPLF